MDLSYGSRKGTAAERHIQRTGWDCSPLDGKGYVSTEAFDGLSTLKAISNRGDVTLPPLLIAWDTMTSSEALHASIYSQIDDTPNAAQISIQSSTVTDGANDIQKLVAAEKKRGLDMVEDVEVRSPAFARVHDPRSRYGLLRMHMR